MSTLTLRQVAIDTYKENVAYLHRDCKLYRGEGFQTLSKIEIFKQDNGQPIIAVLNVVDDEGGSSTRYLYTIKSPLGIDAVHP